MLRSLLHGDKTIWRLGRWMLAFLILSVAAASARAEKRIALVIGNSAYVHVPHLPNPRRDAAAIASALWRLGFDEVIERSDLTTAQMLDELRAFGNAALGAEWAVVFYAGHGLQLDGQNYLIPIDARLKRAMDVEDEAIPLDRVLSKVRQAHKLRLVVLDACRDNPFAVRLEQAGRKRSLGRGLARIELGTGELVAYAARDGQQADDGDGEHSPYTAALLKEMEKPGVEVNLLFRRVHDAVMSQTRATQEPYVYGALPAEPFYFKKPPPTDEQPSIISDASAGDAHQRDEAGRVWQSLKDTTSEAQLQQFTNDYGDTPYARYARVRLREIRIHSVQRLVDECDWLTASPSDERRKGEGVAFNRINTALAIPVCQQAAAARPEDGRLMFLLGRALVAKGSFAQAEAWYEKAAAKGEALAMNGLGVLHEHGNGVSLDYVMARQWYEKAAAKGAAPAMNNLGALYERGVGVRRDSSKAREWFEKAAAKGEALAMNNLGALYERGDGVARDYAKAHAWFEKAAALGEALAMHNLGVLYERGEGVAVSRAKAREWYEKAANAGSQMAKGKLKR